MIAIWKYAYIDKLPNLVNIHNNTNHETNKIKPTDVKSRNDLIDLVKNIKFRKVRNDFQKQLHEDLKKVRSSKKTLTFADKTSNMYRLDKEEYRHLLQNAVTTTYKKSNKETERRINCEGIKYAKEANILDKVEVNGTANCCITLKDHKANFLNHPTTRLINPAKNEIGRISK